MLGISVAKVQNLWLISYYVGIKLFEVLFYLKKYLRK